MGESIGPLALGVCEKFRLLTRQLQYPQRFNYSITSSIILTTWQLLEEKKNSPFLLLCQAALFVKQFPAEMTTNQQRVKLQNHYYKLLRFSRCKLQCSGALSLFQDQGKHQRVSNTLHVVLWTAVHHVYTGTPESKLSQLHWPGCGLPDHRLQVITRER